MYVTNVKKVACCATERLLRMERCTGKRGLIYTRSVPVYFFFISDLTQRSLLIKSLKLHLTELGNYAIRVLIDLEYVVSSDITGIYCS